MQVRYSSDPILLKLEPGDEVVSSIRTVCEKMDVQGAAIEGIGAVKNVEIGFFDLANKIYRRTTFEDEYELLSLLGNVTRAGDETIVHAHVLLGRLDYSAFGGHLFSAEVAVTAEIFIRGNQPIHRDLDEMTGLKLWKL